VQVPTLDGIFCSSDLIAYGVTLEAGISDHPVPQALKVLGLGDMPFAADVLPAISTVKIHTAQIAQHAARHIAGRRPGPQPACIDVGFSLLRRQSS
jgi:LacI family gluconate utilization system Gnt-I transcriptional repressor